MTQTYKQKVRVTNPPPRRQATQSVSKRVQNREIVKRWGEDVCKNGWTAIPNLLLEYQGRLEIKDPELVLLMQLMKYWWSNDQHPFPSVRSLAEAMGKDARTIQRSLKKLEENDFPVRKLGAKDPGYLQRIERKSKNGGRQTSNSFSFDGLRLALIALTKEDELSKEKRRKRQPQAAQDAGAVKVQEVLDAMLKSNPDLAKQLKL